MEPFKTLFNCVSVLSSAKVLETTKFATLSCLLSNGMSEIRIKLLECSKIIQLTKHELLSYLMSCGIHWKKQIHKISAILR